MKSRRAFLTLVSPAALAAVATLAVAPAFVGEAQAFEFRPYDDAAVKKAIASGARVVIHVYAPWCLQCRMQASHLGGLEADKTYDGVAFFRVDYDGQPEIVKALGVPRSTLIGYRGGRELARMSWGMSKDSVLGVLNAVL